MEIDDSDQGTTGEVLIISIFYILSTLYKTQTA